jgi:hypothetical protein
MCNIGDGDSITLVLYPHGPSQAPTVASAGFQGCPRYATPSHVRLLARSYPSNAANLGT